MGDGNKQHHGENDTIYLSVNAVNNAEGTGCLVTVTIQLPKTSAYPNPSNIVPVSATDTFGKPEWVYTYNVGGVGYDIPETTPTSNLKTYTLQQFTVLGTMEGGNLQYSMNRIAVSFNGDGATVSKRKKAKGSCSPPVTPDI